MLLATSKRVCNILDIRRSVLNESLVIVDECRERLLGEA